MRNKKLDKYLKGIVDEIGNYFGERNRSVIDENAKKLRVVIVPKGSQKLDFLGGEPYCIKKPNNNFIIAPEHLFYEDYGIPMFTHSLIHALSEDSFVLDGKEAFNEVVVDLITNDICAKLEEKGINFTYCDYPNYKSESFYSSLANPIKSFFETNKQKILDSRVNKNVKINTSMEKIITDLENKVSEYYDKSFERLEENGLQEVETRGKGRRY